MRGQQGINLIERVALAMHCTWTPTGATEVGIDGYIELFDPGTQHSLGKSLGVQSKVNATFSNERDRRAGPDANRQKRGQVTRQLKAELQKAITDGND